MKIINDERCLEYQQSGHPERPARVSRSIKHLQAQHEISLDWERPSSVGQEQLIRVHTKDLVAQLDQPFDLDPDTPYFPNIGECARLSVGAALKALDCADRGEKAFSLMRPPGHHATQDKIMGFCYLNNIAIAVQEALNRGYERVAVYDFDVHHGNGTEAILHNKPGTAFFSIHQHPCFPGTGTESFGNCYNFPVRPGTPQEEYRGIFERSLDALRDFNPQLVAVSAGFDAYRKDPLSNETLESEDFQWLGERIGRLGYPTFSLLEGGYSDDLPELILAYLVGWQKGSESL